jgi:hypothetical protein
MCLDKKSSKINSLIENKQFENFQWYVRGESKAKYLEKCRGRLISKTKYLVENSGKGAIDAECRFKNNWTLIYIEIIKCRFSWEISWSEINFLKNWREIESLKYWTALDSNRG